MNFPEFYQMGKECTQTLLARTSFSMKHGSETASMHYPSANPQKAGGGGNLTRTPLHKKRFASTPSPGYFFLLIPLEIAPGDPVRKSFWRVPQSPLQNTTLARSCSSVHFANPPLVSPARCLHKGLRYFDSFPLQKHTRTGILTRLLSA